MCGWYRKQGNYWGQELSTVTSPLPAPPSAPALYTTPRPLEKGLEAPPVIGLTSAVNASKEPAPPL